MLDSSFAKSAKPDDQKRSSAKNLDNCIGKVWKRKHLIDAQPGKANDRKGESLAIVAAEHGVGDS
jgi:hypothetical protein